MIICISLKLWFVINLLYEPNKVLVGCVERGIIAKGTYQVTSVVGNFGSEDGGTGILSAAGHFPQALLQPIISSLIFHPFPFLLSIFCPPSHKAQGFAHPLYHLFSLQCIASFLFLKLSGLCSSILHWKSRIMCCIPPRDQVILLHDALLRLKASNEKLKARLNLFSEMCEP